MKMKLAKRITIDIYDTGESTITEEEFMEFTKPEVEDKEQLTVKEIANITRSWEKYNLITYSKKSRLYSELKEISSQGELKLQFMGKKFIGKMDGSTARIFALKELMQFARDNGLEFKEGRRVELLFNKSEKVLIINLL